MTTAPRSFARAAVMEEPFPGTTAPMRRVHAADSSAPPAAAWSLVAEPRRWAEWAPHVRGAWGLGAPEVQAGKLGAAKLLGAVPVPAKVMSVDPGRAWTWRVGPLTLVHAVDPRPDGCRVSMILDGPAPIVLAYGPLVGALTRRLARVATAELVANRLP